MTTIKTIKFIKNNPLKVAHDTNQVYEKMKKAIMMFCMLMTLFASNMLAQEKVRGIETRLVKTGETKNSMHLFYDIEFTNRNSIPVSVTMELWKRGYRDNGYKDQIEQSKDVVLEPKESYVWKINVHKEEDGNFIWRDYYGTKYYYYYKYEAYKLL